MIFNLDLIQIIENIRYVKYNTKLVKSTRIVYAYEAVTPFALFKGETIKYKTSARYKQVTYKGICNY